MATYAVTTVAHQRRALFLKTANSELLLSILIRYREQGRYLLHGFAIMPEHLHVLMTPATGQTIERCVQCIKGGFSFQLRRQSSGEVWQTGFHEHRIRDEQDFQNQLAYIAANPEQRHLVDHRFVHTCYPDQTDPMPMGCRDSTSGAKAPFISGIGCQG